MCKTRVDQDREHRQACISEPYQAGGSPTLFRSRSDPDWELDPPPLLYESNDLQSEGAAHLPAC